MSAPDLSILRDGAERLSISLDEQQLHRFGHYLRLIQDANERAGLTSVDDDEGIQRRHFLESLAILAILHERGYVPSGAEARLIDIGSGAGLPGLPLKIAEPGLAVTLLEATGKKARFLHEAIQGLGLANITAIQDRAENLAHDPSHREAYDLVTARALAPLPVLLELTLPFARPGGIVALPKGSSLDAELPAAKQALSVLGGKVSDVTPLPGSPNLRLVIVQKRSRTQKRYPRRPGIPAKQPL